MARKLAWGVLVVGWGALAVWLTIGETGPVGWLDAWQQAHSGQYSHRLSAYAVAGVAVLLACPVVIALRIADVRARLAPADRNDPAKLAQVMQPTPLPSALTHASLRSWIAAWFVLAALTWLAVVAWQLWQTHGRSLDASATYVEQDAGAPPPPGADHLALRGRLLGEYTVAKKASYETSPELELVPVVGPTWHSGEPVRYVARIERGDVSGVDASARLRVRVGGELPSVAVPIFAKQGIALVADPVVVKLLPAAASTERAIDWSELAIIAGLVIAGWTALLVAIGGALWNQRRKDRKRGDPSSQGGRTRAASDAAHGVEIASRCS